MYNFIDMNDFPQYSAAIKLASAMHAGQTYGDSDKPYTYHLLNVTKIVRERNEGKVTRKRLDELMAVAMLHDIIEDTDINGWDLDAHGIRLSVALAVISITKFDDEEYEDYMKEVIGNPLALEVKICDTATNLEHSVRAGSFKRVEKYSKQLQILNAVLKEQTK